MTEGWVQIDLYFREAERSYLERFGPPTKADVQMLRADLEPTTAYRPNVQPELRWLCWDLQCPRTFDTADQMHRHHAAAHVRQRRQEKLARAS